MRCRRAGSGSRPFLTVSFCRSFSCLFFLFLPVWAALAADHDASAPEYSHQVWQADAGLPSNTIQAIAQTRDGYLWLGTKGGLVRFDGARFDVFDRISTPAIRCNDIMALREDGAGRLWIGTLCGGLVQYSAGKFTSFTSKDGLPSDFVGALETDRDGSLWIGTAAGLTRFSNGSFTTYTTRDGLPGNAVSSLQTDGQGNLWIGTRAGLCLFRDGKFTAYETGAESPENNVPALLEDQAGQLWVGTGRGLSLLKNGRLIHFADSPKLVRALWQDRKGNLWVGTTGRGLFRLNGEKFIPHDTQDGRSPDFIGAIYEDREGNLWLGTYGSGLSRLKPAVFHAYTTRDGLSHNFVFSLTGDRAGDLWLGTYGGGLNKFSNGRFTAYTTRDGLSSNIVRVVCEDRAGNLWAGTYGGGLNRLRDGRITVYTRQDGLADNNIYALYEDRSGNLWIGTDHGLSRWDGRAFKNWTKSDGLPHDIIRAVYEDRSGGLWLGTYGGGLTRLKDGKFTVWNSSNGFPDDFIVSLDEDEAGNLWVVTYGSGVVRFDSSDRFISLTTRDGLFDNLVYQVLDDHRGRLWMSCNRGIFYVRRQDVDDLAAGRIRTLNSVVYSTGDGLKTTECNGGNQPAAWRARDGSLWFPTIAGAARLEPQRLDASFPPPPVVIERLVAGEQALAAQSGLTLAPGQNRIEFQYTALSFRAPEKSLFRYRLEGFDREWINAGTRRSAYYTNLPPGRFTFRVMVCNENGQWNERGAALRFSIKPHFYQTGIFILLCLGGLALLLAACYGLRLRQMKRREQELMTLVSERTRQLEEVNQTLHQLSVQDGLTGIANRRRFDEFIDSEWKRAARAGVPLSLMLIDIDFFKAYNDALGHQQGDDCLRRVAAVLAGSFKRASDLVARYGGEEFVVVCYDQDHQEALRLAETLCARVADLHLPHPASPVMPYVTISAGVATEVPAISGAPGTLVIEADGALYRAKHAGRNQVRSSLPDYQEFPCTALP